MKLNMIYFHSSRIKQALEVILTNQYIKMDGYVMLDTIYRQLTVNDMHRNLMG